MKVSIVGCGDAFGSGGRSNTCFRVDSGGQTILADFGASALVAWSRLGFDTADIDAIAISHLHGDHFGGLPFLLLHLEYVATRTSPLTIAGPPGIRSRLEALCEAMFPGMTAIAWRFPLAVIEVNPGDSTRIGGFEVRTVQVVHPSGAPATGLRISDGSRTFAYSGDTAWTEALIGLADGADLFMVECYSAAPGAPHHIDWPTLSQNLSRFMAKRTVLTHLGSSALELSGAMERAGVEIAEDGRVYEL
jgi:ribonuclease BN (tRNA processing enzyme)